MQTREEAGFTVKFFLYKEKTVSFHSAKIENQNSAFHVFSKDYVIALLRHGLITI